jgi:fatty acid desaturase
MSLPIPLRTLKRLSLRSDAAGGRQLAGHVILIALAMAWVLGARHSGWIVPAMVVLGVLEVALFAPLHETTHRTPFRSRRINRVVGIVAGFVLILPPEWFRRFHMAHHRYTQDPVRDPELIGATPLTRGGYWLKLSGLPYWLSQIRMLSATAWGKAGEFWIPRVERASIVLEARFYVVAYILLALSAITVHSALPLLLWVGPVLLGQPVLRYVLLAEHAGCPQVSDPFTNTRTTVADALFRFVFWNANFHAEHHLAPGVPFHALPALHEEVKAQLGRIDPSYSAAHGAIRSGLTA